MGESLLGGVPLRSMPACCTPLCWVVRAAEPFLDASLKSIQSMGVELQLITCHPALARVILHKGVWQACMHITLLCSWLHRWHLWGVYDVHPVASHDIQSGIHTLQAARSPSHALTRRSLACRHVETILCSRLRKGPVLDPYKRRIMTMPDGGSVALDFEDLPLAQDLPKDAPVIILLPGPHAIVAPLASLSFKAKACCSYADSARYCTGMLARPLWVSTSRTSCSQLQSAS